MSEQMVNIKFKFNVEITVTICHVNVNKLNPAVIGSRRVHLDFIQIRFSHHGKISQSYQGSTPNLNVFHFYIEYFISIKTIEEIFNL